MQDIFRYAVRLAMGRFKGKRAFEMPAGTDPEFFVRQDRVPMFTDWMRDLRLKEAFKGQDNILLRAQRGDLAVLSSIKSLDGLDEAVEDRFFFSGSNPNPSKLTRRYYLEYPFEYLYGQDGKRLQEEESSRISPARQRLEDLFKKGASDKTDRERMEYDRNLRALKDTPIPGRGTPGSSLYRRADEE